MVVRIGKLETVLVELAKAIGADAIYAHREVSRNEVKEEEKEQCSPVSVLDPPFQDDDEGRDGEDDDDEDGCDLKCSYANVQRTKHHLLQTTPFLSQMSSTATQLPDHPCSSSSSSSFQLHHHTRDLL
ncbi:hypothetical protein ACFX2A_014644 [Malus domestica]